MFDSTVQNNKTVYNNEITFNSVAGTLVKSTEKSRIVRFHKDSELAKTFFDIENPHFIKEVKKKYSYGSYESYIDKVKIPIIILQVMLCGGDNYLVEFLIEEVIE